MIVVTAYELYGRERILMNHVKIIRLYNNIVSGQMHDKTFTLCSNEIVWCRCACAFYQWQSRIRYSLRGTRNHCFTRSCTIVWVFWEIAIELAIIRGSRDYPSRPTGSLFPVSGLESLRSRFDFGFRGYRWTIFLSIRIKRETWPRIAVGRCLLHVRTGTHRMFRPLTADRRDRALWTSPGKRFPHCSGWSRVVPRLNNNNGCTCESQCTRHPPVYTIITRTCVAFDVFERHYR
jgi:hypothetical protein